MFPGYDRSRLSTAFAFLEAYGVPHILGAVDCTQVKIFPPPLPHGVQYLNRKGVHSPNVQLVSNKLIVKDRNIVAAKDAS